MRVHLAQCLKLELFLIAKNLKRSKGSKVVTIYVCMICKKVDDGTVMVECETCKHWFHKRCTDYDDKDDNWHCTACMHMHPS